MSKKTKKSEEDAKIAKTRRNYIHTGWCQEGEGPIWPQVLEDARKILVKAGVDIKTVKDTENFPSHYQKRELCELIDQHLAHEVGPDSTCAVTTDTDTPPELVIKMRIANKITCFNVIELDRKLRTDPAFAARFSEWQIARIAKRVQLLTSTQPEACAEYVRNPAACEKQRGRCTYNRRSLVGALVGSRASKREEGGCYLSDSIIKQLQTNCTASDTSTLQAVLMDLFDHVFSVRRFRAVEEAAERAGVETREESAIEVYFFADQVEKLKAERKDYLRTLDLASLCTLFAENIDNYISSAPLSFSEQTITNLKASTDKINEFLTAKVRYLVVSAREAQAKARKALAEIASSVAATLRTALSSPEAFLRFIGATAITKESIQTLVGPLTRDLEWGDTVVDVLHFLFNAALFVATTFLLGWAQGIALNAVVAVGQKMLLLPGMTGLIEYLQANVTLVNVLANTTIYAVEHSGTSTNSFLGLPLLVLNATPLGAVFGSVPGWDAVARDVVLRFAYGKRT